MKRRNIVIVDDDRDLAIKVEKGIKDFYLKKNEWDYNVILFNEEGHFQEAKKYISESLSEIDILICDQKLIGGQGLQLFKMTDREDAINLGSILIKPFVYRVLQSNQDRRFIEIQDEHMKLYIRFINSDIEKDLIDMLIHYETNVLTIKENGNPIVNEQYYNNERLTKFREKIKLDNTEVKIRDILFMYLDNENRKSDTYHFVYFVDEEIRTTAKPIKPTLISTTINTLEFLEIQLKEDNQVLCKINPLWILSIMLDIKTINLFTPFSKHFTIHYEKIKSHVIPQINFQF